jgi:endonuclease YncB( thermonuclease family)
MDGDTVDIVDDVRGRLRIRLLGIDTPETKKMWMKSTYFARLGTSLAGRGSSMR